MDWIDYIIQNVWFFLPVLGGMLLDTIFGDPKWFPHPVKLFGRLIKFCDHVFNTGTNRRLKGAFVGIFLVFMVWAVLYGLANYFYKDNLYLIVSVLLFYSAVAGKSLLIESLKVEKQLEVNGLEAARKQLAHIVGRDTLNLTANKVRQAVLETLSENLSDGVIAPLFYYLIGGIPLMLAYKMVNTLDSMIGYKNEKYREFGYFAARLDDVANLVPSRLTAMLLVVVSFSRRGLTFIFKYAHLHSSPNAGYPEAALAGILNCRLGGPAIYNNHIVEKLYLGENQRDITKKDIFCSCRLNVLVTLLMVTCMIFIYIILN